MSKLNPYVMMPMRRAYVEVIGKLWGGGKAAATYNLTDTDLASLGDQFTAESMDKWVASHTGDFQDIIDYNAVCGEHVVPWDSEDNEDTFYRMGG